ncbi:glycine cleavage system aminomethyltransferase GcvT [Sulfuriroseicoccus oceanibius]|uniref:Aminomethyltransferase n=1 Tax=Sulfuriroseicoccus oceanibius TaxID=2707525 RepID=A0A6B3L918_9BACT|nr:glycine cleavage system aminomethyltransferase GcvT [Sulfuriroseicoccus oceanibius]QQL44339.1 glycine cleavage system aminomethyltransferase GcvT [Sulfuriroseicoccus oceanibius]
MANSSDADIKQTPLREVHEKFGARMVPFAGWNMPVQYSGIKAEHLAVRNDVGVFDISHMGQFIVSGENAGAWLNRQLTADINKLGDGQGQYTFMLNEQGGVIDDLIIYRTAADSYFMVVNASMIDEDYAWLAGKLEDGVTLENHSDAWAGLAVQGPKSSDLYSKLIGDALALPPRNGIATAEVDGETIVVCRTGYTGEDGYEFFCASEQGPKWFERFVTEGEEFGCLPCGLGARDSLRLEVCYPLNGSDLSPTRTPLQAGLKFAVAMDKGEFTGRSVLAKQLEEGLGERLVAFKMVGKSPPPRPHYPVAVNGEIISEACSAGLSPSLNEGIGMTYLPTELAKIGTQIEIDIRGRRFNAEIVKKPFYKKG